MRLAKDRIYLTAVVLAALSIGLLGAFLYRDYASPTLQSVNLGSGTGQAAGPTANAGSGAASSGGGTTTSQGGGTARPGSSGSTGSVSSSPACQGGTITVGQIVPITGPVSEKTAQQATQAYFNMVNAHGGISGCQVKLISLDDGGLNQQQAAADARQLVDQNKVFAIVGNIEPVTGASTASFFAQAGVPVVGVDGVGIQEYNNPVEYSFAEAPAGFGVSTEDYLHSLGFHRPAVFYLDFDFGHASFSAFQQQAARNGDSIAYSNAENVSSTSYPTDVLAAQSANPDVVVNIMDANSVVREMNAMQSNNWYPSMVATTSTSDPVVQQADGAWLSHPGHTVYVQRNYLTASDPSSPVQQWISTEGYYYPGFDPNSYAEGAWLGAKIFTELAAKEGSNLSRATLLADLNKMSNYQTGFTVPISMTSDHGPNREVIWLKWGGSGFTQITGWQGW